MTFFNSLPLWLQSAIQVIALLAFFVSLTVGLVQVLRWLFTRKQGYPREAEIEAALKPFAVQAIWAAYRASERQVDEIGHRLRGIDKYELAKRLYALLPDSIPVTVPTPGGSIVIHIPLAWIKTFFSEEDFAALIQSTFDEFEYWLEANQDRLGEEVSELLKELE